MRHTHLEGLYVLLAWSVADFSSCQGNNLIKSYLILSGLNCNNVFCSISLTKMFTKKAQGSRLTLNCVCMLSAYEEHQKANKTKA